jgi:hypothetical protein
MSAGSLTMSGKAAGALFNQKTIENALKAFTFPPDLADRHQKVQEWITSLKSGKLAKVKEVSLHGPFLNDIFQTVLGYRSIIGGDRWELHAEQTIADGGGSADGAHLPNNSKEPKPPLMLKSQRQKALLCKPSSTISVIGCDR